MSEPHDTAPPVPPVPPVEEPEGGDAVCWAHRVCQECGRLNEAERPIVCENCGARFE
ncbi:MAG: hypothetical protein ABI429_09015 [Jatrophihabitantaceae bacterium]